MSSNSSSALQPDPAPLFAALGDSTRLSLVMTLSDGRKRSIASLSAGGIVTRQAISKHLDILERAGLVSKERAGRETRFLLRPERIAAIRSYLDNVSAQWDEALARLQSHLES